MHNENIDKNSKLRPAFDKKISKNLCKELRLILTKKIGKSLNKKLGTSFIYNNMHLKKKAAISIIEISSKIYKSKIYDKAIANLIHGTRWWQAMEKKIRNLKIY